MMTAIIRNEQGVLYADHHYDPSDAVADGFLSEAEYDAIKAAVFKGAAILDDGNHIYAVVVEAGVPAITVLANYDILA